MLASQSKRKVSLDWFLYSVFELMADTGDGLKKKEKF